MESFKARKLSNQDISPKKMLKLMKVLFWKWKNYSTWYCVKKQDYKLCITYLENIKCFLEEDADQTFVCSTFLRLYFFTQHIQNKNRTGNIQKNRSCGNFIWEEWSCCFSLINICWLYFLVQHGLCKHRLEDWKYIRIYIS